AAERVDAPDDFGVDFARQDLLDHVHGCLVRHAQAPDEVGLQAGGVHGARDGLAAAVDDDGVDADGFEKHDVARHAVAHQRIGRIHETAAVFHDERLAAETLDIRQRLEQHVGFGNKLVHHFTICD